MFQLLKKMAQGKLRYAMLLPLLFMLISIEPETALGATQERESFETNGEVLRAITENIQRNRTNRYLGSFRLGGNNSHLKTPQALANSRRSNSELIEALMIDPAWQIFNMTREETTAFVNANTALFGTQAGGNPAIFMIGNQPHTISAMNAKMGDGRLHERSDMDVATSELYERLFRVRGWGVAESMFGASVFGAIPPQGFGTSPAFLQLLASTTDTEQVVRAIDGGSDSIQSFTNANIHNISSHLTISYEDIKMAQSVSLNSGRQDVIQAILREFNLREEEFGTFMWNIDSSLEIVKTQPNTRQGAQAAQQFSRNISTLSRIAQQLNITQAPSVHTDPTQQINHMLRLSGHQQSWAGTPTPPLPQNQQDVTVSPSTNQQNPPQPQWDGIIR